jgi:hypothetical protein
VLSPKVIEKLAFMHDLTHAQKAAASAGKRGKSFLGLSRRAGA